MENKKYKTSSGFEYEINTQNLNDMTIIDGLITMNDATVQEHIRVVAMIRVLRGLLGEEQKDALYAHVIQKEGQAKTEAIGRELREIIESLDENKKK